MLEISNKAMIYQNGNLNRDHSVELNMQSIDQKQWTNNFVLTMTRDRQTGMKLNLKHIVLGIGD